MIDEAATTGDEQTDKSKTISNIIRHNRFSGGLLYSERYLASNANKLQMQLNTHYITQICCPRRPRSTLSHVRMRPYYIPKRSRTKSENSEPALLYLEQTQTPDIIQSTTNQNSILMETSDPTTSQMDTSSHSQLVPKPGKGNTLTKSKSLEDLVRAVKCVDGSQPSHEMEFVSSRIQKLKVQE